MLKAGLQDRDVQSTVREEHSQGARRWIQTTRVLNVPPPLDIPSLAQQLRAAVQEPGLETAVVPEGPRGKILDFSWQGKLLEHLILRGAASSRPGGKAARGHHKVALVIDDVAGKPDPFQRYFNLNVPLTFAILPGDKNSRAFSRLLAGKRDRYEYILHLPLEPHRSWPDKDHGLLRVAMTPAEKVRLLEKHLDDVPGADGVSNHMGSAFTEDKTSMKIILEKIKARGIFFFDSHTSLTTVAYPTAKGMGIPTALNRVFLDNQDDAVSIGRELETLLKISKRRGATAAIGHFHRKHLAEALAKAIPEFKKNGIEFVTLQDVLEPPPS
jgi:polysaccharide deacetylase 2 family uncharacterized protein YibQ